MIEVKKFWREACGPCRTLAPIMDKVIVDYPNIELININTDEDNASGGKLISEYGVRSVPFVVIEKDGQIVDKFVGSRSEAELREILDKISKN